MKHTVPRSDRAAPRRLLAPALVVSALILGACGGGPEPELVAFTPTATPAPTAAPAPTPTRIPQPTPEPEVLSEVLEREPDVPMWTVVDSVDSLNMRADPTTSAEIVATLEPGDSGLAGTGETATADGLEWVELAADQDRPAGWVAVQFLVPEEPTVTDG